MQNKHVRLIAVAYLIGSFCDVDVRALAQSAVTFQYVYDSAGQLKQVIDSTGVVLTYSYDLSGNIINVSRTSITPGSLAIFAVMPTQIFSGGVLLIQGQGFSGTPGNNIVKINGVTATVVSANANVLTVTVPNNATSGTLTVTVGANTVSAPVSITVVVVPVITSIAPKAALSGTGPTIQVTGANLTGCTMAFVGPGIGAVTITNTTIAAGGASATLAVSVAANAPVGRYALSASCPTASSDPAATKGNTLVVPGSDPNGDPDNDLLTNAQEIALGTDPLNPDTDGDGWIDGDEVSLGSDPLDPNSKPVLNPNPNTRESESLGFSVYNATPEVTNPQTDPIREIESLPFSLYNATPEVTNPQTDPVKEFEGVAFSVQNLSPAPPPATQATGAVKAAGKQEPAKKK